MKIRPPSITQATRRAECTGCLHTALQELKTGSKIERGYARLCYVSRVEGYPITTQSSKRQRAGHISVASNTKTSTYELSTFHPKDTASLTLTAVAHLTHDDTETSTITSALCRYNDIRASSTSNAGRVFGLERFQYNILSKLVLPPYRLRRTFSSPQSLRPASQIVRYKNESIKSS